MKKLFSILTVVVVASCVSTVIATQSNLGNNNHLAFLSDNVEALSRSEADYKHCGDCGTGGPGSSECSADVFALWGTSVTCSDGYACCGTTWYLAVYAICCPDEDE